MSAPTSPVRFALGHGTGNDFVLLPDPGGDLDLDAGLAARLCDRHRGLGGDGVIRVVRTTALAEGAASLAEAGDADWFMDYRNADGSLAQMCGNGVRVLAAYLVAEGFVDPAVLDSGAGVAIGTRAGVKRVRRTTGPGGLPWLATDMGVWRLPVPGAVGAGHDATVVVAGLDDVARPALSVDLGNPHTVVALADVAELAAADLSRPPQVDPAPAQGTNVELIVPGEPAEVTSADAGWDRTADPADDPVDDSLDDPVDDPVGRLVMRVHERGSGETLSCGTGVCAAAVAAHLWGGPSAPRRWLVDVPGGTLGVRLLAGDRLELAGPAVLVAHGTLDSSWLDLPNP